MKQNNTFSEVFVFLYFFSFLYICFDFYLEFKHTSSQRRIVAHKIPEKSTSKHLLKQPNPSTFALRATLTLTNYRYRHYWL